MMNILVITLLNILFKIWLRIKIEFKSDFETKDIFQKRRAMILERPRQSFGFEFESNTCTSKSKTIHQYKNKCMAA
jgi:hypothetical protein